MEGGFKGAPSVVPSESQAHHPSDNNACPQWCGGKGLWSMRTTLLHRATSAAREHGSVGPVQQRRACWTFCDIRWKERTSVR
jgi:hypothetical protein